MTKEEIESAAKHTYNNRDEIEKSKMCGYYYCTRTFPASLIRYDDYRLMSEKWRWFVKTIVVQKQRCG